jgi:hypothetical protein
MNSFKNSIYNMVFPLREKKSLFNGVRGTFAVALAYLIVATSITLFTTKSLPDLPLHLLVLFGIMKTWSQIVKLELVVFALLLLSSFLLFANYSYWKCRKEISGKAGLAAGMFALVCPSCILPLLGLASFSAAMVNVSYFLKFGAIALVLLGTYFVANKKVCEN